MRESVPALRINMLGPPALTWRGRAFHLPRKQLRALLYLLAESSRPITRDHFCLLFWGDLPDQTARRNLTRLLALLRHSLPEPDLLQINDELISLDPNRTWCDCIEFSRLCSLPVEARSIGILEKAAKLYGGAFLQGFNLPHNADFDAWQAQQRQVYERHYLSNLNSLVDACSATGDLNRALDYARLYLETDDLAEEMHRRMIELYAAVGDRTAALRQYERCAAILERELGVSPLPETLDLYRSVLDGRTPEILPGRPAVPAPDRTQAPIVGYTDARSRLTQAYRLASQGSGAVVLIRGEAGAGKSRLVQEFIKLLPPVVRVLSGSSYPDTQNMPYHPVVQLLNDALPGGLELPPGENPWMNEVARLIPGLQHLVPGLAPNLHADTEQARSRLADALCSLAMTMRRLPHPLAIWLEDVQWADTLTREWVCTLGRRARGMPLLVLVTCNPEAGSPLDEIRISLQRAGALVEIELTGLDEDATLDLLRFFNGIQPGDQAAAVRLHLATGGNPFFLIETLRALLETGQSASFVATHDAWPITETVRNAVKDRLSRLTPIARQVLGAAAVLGTNFSFDVILRTAGRNDNEILDGLEELIARHILQEQGDSYRFVHEIIRQTVYTGLGYWRKRLLHRRAGEAIRVHKPGDYAALTHHFENTELPGQAAWYALQAGFSASKLHAHIEATQFFNHALDLLRSETPGLQDRQARHENYRLQIQALEGRGWFLRLLGNMAAYENDLEEVGRLAGLLGDERSLAHLRWREAVTHRWHCRYLEARYAAQEGVLLSQASGSHQLEARCLREDGLAAREMGQYAQARQALESALHAFIDLEDAYFEIHAMGNLSRLFWCLGDFERAQRLASQAMERCLVTGMTYHRRIPLGDMGAALAGSGEYRPAQGFLQESLTLARQIDDRTQEIFCLGHLGWLSMQEGQPDPAKGYLKSAYTLALQIGSMAEQSWLLAGMAEADGLRGDRQQGLQHARMALSLASQAGRSYDETLARNVIFRLESSSL